MLFPSMPDHASLWSYTSSRPLSKAVEAELLGALEAFYSTWTSHEQKVFAQSILLESRYLFIAAYIPNGDLSGCGIDKSTRLLDEIARSNNFEWLDRLVVHFRDETGSVKAVSRSLFRSYIRDGIVSGETVVYDFTARSVGSLRSNGIERPASDSWHSRVFGIPPVRVAGT